MKTEKPEKTSTNNILKYSGLGFQMLAMIAVATWLGIIIDKRLEMKTFPAFTFTLVLAAVIGSLVSLVKSVNKDN